MGFSPNPDLGALLQLAGASSSPARGGFPARREQEVLEGCDVARHAATTQVFGEVVVAPKAITSREKLLQAGGPAKRQAGSRGCSGKGWGEVASRRQIGFGVGSRSDSAAPIPQQSPGEAGGTAHKPTAGRAGAWREPGREGKGFFLGGEAGRVSTRLLTTKARGQTCTQIRFPLTCLPACPCHSGISGKSQILFALVFTTRYLDLFTTFISAYNTVMKVRRGSTKEVSLGWPWFAGEGEGAASPPRLSSQREEGETPSPPTITKSTAGYRQKGS